jgi:hypothetical protein
MEQGKRALRSEAKPESKRTLAKEKKQYLPPKTRTNNTTTETENEAVKLQIKQSRRETNKPTTTRK